MCSLYSTTETVVDVIRGIAIETALQYVGYDGLSFDDSGL